MKKLLLILILTFSFQTLAKADDISDFEIEGISIGDSALIYFSEKLIKKNSRSPYKDKKYTVVQNDKLSYFETYDFFDFRYSTNDNNYMLDERNVQAYIGGVNRNSSLVKYCSNNQAPQSRTTKVGCPR